MLTISRPPLSSSSSPFRSLLFLDQYSTFISYAAPILSNIPHLRDLHDLSSTSSVHSLILKSGLSSDIITVNHLLNAYIRCNEEVNAEKLFKENRHSRNVVTWTSLMAGFIAFGQPTRCLSLFSLMRSSEGVLPNSFTVSTAVKACALLADVKSGTGIHGQVEILGFGSDVVVATSLIDMYAKLNRVEDASLVFDGMTGRNVITWGSMISAYTQNAKGQDALDLFREFLRLKLEKPNHFMFSSIVNACAGLGRLGVGKCMHAAVIRHGCDENDVIAGALVDMYAKCGCINQSRKVFSRIPVPTVVPYTSMIIAAGKHGQARLSFSIFDEMLGNGVMPNEVTFLGVLHACSHSGLVEEGLRYLRSMEKDYGLVPRAKHYTCAIDMLGRSGRLDEAYELSKEVKAVDDDALLLWTTLLSSCRKHGRVDLATEANKKLMEFSQDAAGAYVVMSNAYASIGNWDSAVGIRSYMKHQGIRKDPGCSWIEIKDIAYVYYSGNVASGGQGSEVLKLLEELEVKMRERGYVSTEEGILSLDVEHETREFMIGMHSERLALAFGLLNTPKGLTIRVMKNLRICLDCHEAFKLISDIVQRCFVVRDLNRFHHFQDGSCSCGDYW